MIKMILKETYTRRDVNGNVYRTAMLMNPKNRLSIMTHIACMGNLINVLTGIFPQWDWSNFYTTSECTNSTKLSSLPKAIYLNECRPTKEWLKALRSIGYRIPSQTKE